MAYHKLLGSSADGQNIALTIKGVLVSIIPVVLLLFKAGGHDVSEAILNQYVDLVYNIVLYSSLAIGNIITLLGLLRKAFYWVWDWYVSMKDKIK